MSLERALGGAVEMNLLEFYQNRGLRAYRASTNKGGEYHGPCPACGGRDRFHVWPQQGEHGTFWCRGCDKGGDAIHYLRQIDGMSYRDACSALGRNPDNVTAQPIQRVSWQPEPLTVPGAVWQEKAGKLVSWANDYLLNSAGELRWLAGRGISRETVETFRLGWNPGDQDKDIWRARESWGLPTEIREDTGKHRRLWLPRGLVIPCLSGPEVHRLRIRRPEGEPRYYVVPGSSAAPLYVGSHHPVAVVVESELDALALVEAAGDLVGVYAIGNTSAKPDVASYARLRKLSLLLVATDFDEPDQRGQRPGTKAARWWLENFPQAERWPVPAGKDPGETYQAGVSLRGWIKAGLTVREVA